MSMRKAVAVLAVVMTALTVSVGGARADSSLTVNQLVDAALEANPQVRAARNRWYAAIHSIKQNYVPTDPTFTYQNVDSPTNGFDHAAAHSFNVAGAFQFPGKALLQAKNAQRNAAVARLIYDATLRDVRARVETGFYQALLDYALAQVTAAMAANLKRVVEVTEVAYSANQVTQTDFISAEFDLAIEQREQVRLEVAQSNDLTALNQLLNRSPDEALGLDRMLRLPPLVNPLDTLVDRATRARQELLEAALAEHNSETSLELARLEYLPDYSLGYTFNNYLIPSAGPTPNSLQDHGFQIGFSLPVFFWFKQREDVARAGYNLEAARADLASIRTETAAAVTSLYRSAQYAYQNASSYRETLIPLARQNFEVALVAYTSGKIDFVTLAMALRRFFDARVNYLQAANQYLAGRVALEQAIGEPLAK